MNKYTLREQSHHCTEKGCAGLITQNYPFFYVDYPVLIIPGRQWNVALTENHIWLIAHTYWIMNSKTFLILATHAVSYGRINPKSAQTNTPFPSVLPHGWTFFSSPLTGCLWQVQSVCVCVGGGSMVRLKSTEYKDFRVMWTETFINTQIYTLIIFF